MEYGRCGPIALWTYRAVDLSRCGPPYFMLDVVDLFFLKLYYGLKIVFKCYENFLGRFFKLIHDLKVKLASQVKIYSLYSQIGGIFTKVQVRVVS